MSVIVRGCEYASDRQLSPRELRHIEEDLREVGNKYGMVFDSYETSCFGVDKSDPIHLSFLVGVVGLFLAGLCAAWYYRRKYNALVSSARRQLAAENKV